LVFAETQSLILEGFLWFPCRVSGGKGTYYFEKQLFISLLGLEGSFGVNRTVL
jgi:hypothetical protein